jgi:hypothetical protein
VHQLLGNAERSGRGFLGGARRGKSRLELGQRSSELGGLFGVACPLLNCLVERRSELDQLLALAGTEVACVLDRLLCARDLGADLVVAALDRREQVGLRGVLGA